MVKRSIIIGMGIGKLYSSVLINMNHTVVTVDLDPAKGADFTSLKDAIATHARFDTAHVCTPNYTHRKIAEEIAPYADIVFVEKPGLKNSKEWNDLVNLRPFTRFIMVKNNMWRNNIVQLAELAERAKIVNINWIRKNCIPSPGSWFTTKDQAFGGVSRDLMPHLLSLYVAMDKEWSSNVAQCDGATRC